jgi:hypothetical protein
MFLFSDVEKWVFLLSPEAKMQGGQEVNRIRILRPKEGSS